VTRIPISGSIFARSTSSSSTSTSSSSTTQPLPFSRRDSVSCARAATTVAVSPNAGASSSHHAAGCGLLWTAYDVRTIAALDKLRDQGTAVPLPGAAAHHGVVLHCCASAPVVSVRPQLQCRGTCKPCEISDLTVHFLVWSLVWLSTRGMAVGKGSPRSKKTSRNSGKRLILEPARPVGHRAGSCPATTP
jgi:hypothetical protein